MSEGQTDTVSAVKRTALLAVAVCLAASPAWAAGNLREVLEAAFVVETRLLDTDLERYGEARRSEQSAQRRMENQSRRLDDALGDRSVAVEALRRLETDLATARETAFTAARESGALRARLYERMDRLAELGREIDRARNRSLVETSQLDGLWRVEVSPAGEFGVVKLEVEGTLVTGTYRLSNGAQGSVRGTFADRRVELERIDSKNGLDSALTGVLDPATGEIQGEWTAVDVSGGRQVGGEWAARKLSPAEERDLESRPR